MIRSGRVQESEWCRCVCDDKLAFRYSLEAILWYGQSLQYVSERQIIGSDRCDCCQTLRTEPLLMLCMMPTDENALLRKKGNHGSGQLTGC